MKPISILAIGAAALLGIGACSSEKQLSVPQGSVDFDDVTLPPGVTLPGGVTIPDITIPDGVTLPPGVTLPGGVTIPDITLPGGVTLPGDIPTGSIPGFSGDCVKWIQALGAAFSGDAQGLETLEQGFAELAEVVPEDLKDDLQVLADGYGKLADKLAEYNGDFTQVYSDPEALAIFSAPEFVQAQSNFSAWLDTECQTAG